MIGRAAGHGCVLPVRMHWVLAAALCMAGLLAVDVPEALHSAFHPNQDTETVTLFGVGVVVPAGVDVSATASLTDLPVVHTTETVDVFRTRNSTTVIEGTVASITETALTVVTPVPAAVNYVIDTARVRQPYYRVRDPTPEVFDVGAMLPLTESDLSFSFLGTQLLVAFKCQIDLINGNNTLLPNTVLTPAVWNAGYQSPSLASDAATRLAMKNVLVTLGPPTNSQTSSVQNIFGIKKLVNIAFSTYSTSQTSDNDYSSRSFSIIPSAVLVAKAIAEMLVRFSWSLIDVMFVPDDGVTSGGTAIIAELYKHNISVACNQTVTNNVVDNMYEFSRCISGTSSNVVLLWMNNTFAAQALSIFHANASLSQLTFVAGGGWELTPSAVFLSHAVEGKVNYARNDSVPRTFPPAYLEGSLSIVPHSGEFSQYRACAQQATEKSMPYTSSEKESRALWSKTMKCYTPQDFGVDDFAFQALPPCSPRVEERTFPCRCTGSESFEQLPIGGYVNLIMDAVLTAALALNNILDTGTCQRLLGDKYSCTDPIMSTDMYAESVERLRFEGLTGLIAFLNGTLAPDASLLDIMQFRESGQSMRVGYANITNAYISASRVKFKEPVPQPEAPAPATTYPSSVISPEIVKFDASFWSAFIVILSGITSVVVLLFMAFVVYRRKAPVLRAMGISWMLLLLGGIVLVDLSNMFWGIMTNTWLCFVKTILGVPGWSLIAAAFAIKARRYATVLLRAGRESKRKNVLSFERAVHAPTLYEVFCVGAVVVAPMLALFILYIADGPQPTIIDTNTPLVQYYACETIHAEWGNALALIMTIYLMVIAAVSCVTFGLMLAANVSSGRRNPSELTFLFFATLNIVVLYLIFAAFYYTLTDTSGGANAQFRIRSICETDAILILILLLSYRVVPRVRGWVLTTRRRMRTHGESKAEARDALEGHWRYEPRGGILAGGTGRGARGDDADESGSDQGEDMSSELSGAQLATKRGRETLLGSPQPAVVSSVVSRRTLSLISVNEAEYQIVPNNVSGSADELSKYSLSKYSISEYSDEETVASTDSETVASMSVCAPAADASAGETTVCSPGSQTSALMSDTTSTGTTLGSPASVEGAPWRPHDAICDIGAKGGLALKTATEPLVDVPPPLPRSPPRTRGA